MRHSWCDLRSGVVPPSGDLLSVVVPPFSTLCALTGIVAAIPRAPGDLRFIAVEPPPSHHIQGDDARPEWAWCVSQPSAMLDRAKWSFACGRVGHPLTEGSAVAGLRLAGCFR